MRTERVLIFLWIRLEAVRHLLTEFSDADYVEAIKFFD